MRPWNHGDEHRGLTQTNVRAELAALLWVAEHLSTPVWLISDNDWVVSYLSELVN